MDKMEDDAVQDAIGNPNDTSTISQQEVWATVLQTTILTVTTVFIITGNLLSFVVLFSSRDSSEVTRLCMLFLTATDTAVGFLICIPVTGATAAGRWPFGDAACLAIAGSTILVSLNSIFVLAINVERFVAIVWPLRSVTYVTKPRAMVALVGSCLLGVFFAVFYCFLPHRKPAYHPYYHTCFMDPDDPKQADTLGILAAFIFAILPFLTTLILYSRLYQIARRHARQISQIGGTCKRRTIKKSDLKTATTFFIITAVLAVSWLPFAVVICYEGVTRRLAHPAVTFLSEVFLFSNSYINILVYYFMNEEFRRAGKKFVLAHLWRGCARHQSRRNNRLETSRISEAIVSNTVLVHHM